MNSGRELRLGYREPILTWDPWVKSFGFSFSHTYMQYLRIAREQTNSYLSVDQLHTLSTGNDEVYFFHTYSLFIKIQIYNDLIDSRTQTIDSSYVLSNIFENIQCHVPRDEALSNFVMVIEALLKTKYDTFLNLLKLLTYLFLFFLTKLKKN